MPIDSNDAVPALEVRDLTVEFKTPAGMFRAVDDVNLTVEPGKTLGIVGESGSGKTTIGRAILGLTPVQQGTILLAGQDITHLKGRQRRPLSRLLQVVFQDPYSSLNPVRTVGQTLSETLGSERLSRAEVAQRVRDILTHVGLDRAAADRYPSQFSGGQRQRIAIARALIAGPRFVVCDEPVSALDLSVQAQVLNLLRSLQTELGLSYLFISHDLSVVRHVSHRLLVLYRGRVVEYGDADELYANPRHPYTRSLLHASPVPDPAAQAQRRDALQAARTAEEVRARMSDGCAFAPRCAFATSLCWGVTPELEPTDGDATVACHHWRDIPPASLPVIASSATAP
ncbi:ABC transporter ATP-binding protein [Microbacterium sp. X-17]|uniref:ABC transporter ATP-binding protein n=1 Tax=Microbacterium sp. X-17 TaxID=3144404 RepID=UPI0031F57D4C